MTTYTKTYARRTVSALCLVTSAIVFSNAQARDTGDHSAASQGAAGRARGPTATLPALPIEKLQAILSGLPNDEASGVLVQIRGTRGEWQGTGGVADVHTKQPVPSDARFRIGSMTKTFTAAVALQLVAEGKLELDQPVQRYLPQLLPQDYPPITVRQVLTYTSGIHTVEVRSKNPDWFFAHRYDKWPPGSQIDVSRPLTFAPGTKQRYGNVDYIVVGLLIQAVTGRSWADEVTDRIIKPLGLHGTSVPRDEVGIQGPHVHAYERVETASGVRWEDVTDADMSLQWSAAAMISTAPDLDRFLVALFKGRVVPEPQLDMMFTVPNVPAYDKDDDPTNDRPAEYSAGLSRYRLGPLTLWGKSGDRPGYNNLMVATRDLSRRLVLSTNTIHMGRPSPAISLQIGKVVFAGSKP